MRIHADPDLHNNLQLVQVPTQNMTKLAKLFVFGLWIQIWMQIRIQGASHNADLCGSRSAQYFRISTSTLKL